jgi:hypothetical protein
MSQVRGLQTAVVCVVNAAAHGCGSSNASHGNAAQTADGGAPPDAGQATAPTTVPTNDAAVAVNDAKPAQRVTSPITCAMVRALNID